MNIENLSLQAKNELFAKYLIVLGQLMLAENITVSQAVNSGAWDITLAVKLQAEGIDAAHTREVVFWASNNFNTPKNLG